MPTENHYPDEEFEEILTLFKVSGHMVDSELTEKIRRYISRRRRPLTEIPETNSRFERILASNA
jgi:type III secretory pathway lipoprotein EscJ